MLKTWFNKPIELKLLALLQDMINALMHFAPDHIRPVECIVKFEELLLQVQDEHNGKIKIFMDRDKELIRCSGMVFSPRDHDLVLLAEKLKESGINSLVISKGANQKELSVFTLILINKTRKQSLVNLSAKMKAAQITHIEINECINKENSEENSCSTWKLTRSLDDTVYWEAYEAAKNLSLMIQLRRTANGLGTRRVVEKLLKSMQEDPEALSAVVFRPQYANWVIAHSVRCSILALRLGLELTKDETIIQLLGETGLLHDIGFFTIPRKILFKPGALLKKERDIMEQHTIKGAKILMKGNDFPPAAIETSLLHHADPLSEGYPEIQKVIKPSIVCKIMRVIDAYESMISGRPYRRPQSPLDAAKELIHKSGSFFDKTIVGAFLRTIGLFPPGSLVKLSDNSIAEVLKTNPNDQIRPSVSIIINANGNTLSSPKNTDLIDEGDITVISSFPLERSVQQDAQIAVN